MLDPSAHVRRAEQAQERKSKLFPMHVAIATQDETGACATIDQLFSQNPESIHALDDLGGTPLHIAAAFKRPRVIEKLFSLGATSDIHTRSKEYRTPLETLEASNLGDREFCEAMLPVWPGFSTAACQSILALRRGEGLALPVPTDNSVTMEDMVKFGCTCGQCMWGFLSPRTRYRIHSMSFKIVHRQESTVVY